LLENVSKACFFPKNVQTLTLFAQSCPIKPKILSINKRQQNLTYQNY
jgi:hypothetical protein